MKIIDYINGKEASEYSDEELLKIRTALTERAFEYFGYKKRSGNLGDAQTSKDI